MMSLGEQRTNQRLGLLICGLIMAILAGLAGFFAWQYVQLRNNPNAVADESAKRITEKVGKLYSLPSDEEPTVAEVKDKTKLAEQEFFKKAENGDFILIFTKAKLAFLYREKDNLLINVGPIAINDQSETTPAPAAAKPTVKVINGSSKTGRAAAVADELRSKLSAELDVSTTYADAQNKNITKAIVVDAKGTRGEIAKRIADTLGGQVGALPAGEVAPDSDILIITGP